MRILFFDLSLPYLLADDDHPAGGAAVQLRAWLHGLLATGNEAGVLTWHGARSHVHDLHGIDLVEAYDRSGGVRYLRVMTKRLPALLAAVRAYAPDALCKATADFNTGLIAQVARMAHVPFVYRVANDTDLDGRYTQRLPRYARIAFSYGIRSAALVLCQTEQQRTKAEVRFGKARVEILPNPFLVPTPGLDGPLPLTARPYVAWLGFFQSQKNLEGLLAIARQLPATQFHVAGRAASNADRETRMLVRKLEAEPNVVLVGHLRRTEVPHFLRRAKFLINTSHYEGFSNTFLESFAAGTPVVIPRHVDPSNIVQRYDLGYVARDTGHLAPTLSTALTQESRAYMEQATRCQSYVMEHHQPEPLADQLVQILGRIGTTETRRRTDAGSSYY
jgi:glycosyltransferase involved in cell wall biosynthesis